ncbi:MAG TPA: extracellular solute-binding protein, partial [Nitrososphaera sp.]
KILGALTLIVFLVVPAGVLGSSQQKDVTLNAIVVAPEERWKTLFGSALEKLKEKHPELNINFNETILPYDEARKQMLSSKENGTKADLYSIDQIWLSEFANKGLLENLTRFTNTWNKSSDWSENLWNGGVYKGDVYGIWAWTDVRALWYLKNILNSSGIDPDSLGTWDGYLDAIKNLQNSTLSPNAVHLVGASHSPDMWYPYLWMLGGDILTQKEGHPENGTYWFPSYNGTEGVKALTFLKEQIDAGVKPQKQHYWGEEFGDRKFAVMLEGSWLPGDLTPTEKATFEDYVGMLPMFPVPEKGNTNATLMGGWLLGISADSDDKDLTWELITTMLEPDVLLPMLKENGYLPTQKSMMSNSTYADSLNVSIPYYDKLISMIPDGHIRPNIPEYPQIADHIRGAINEVYNGTSDPKEALDKAASRTAILLGWYKSPT